MIRALILLLGLADPAVAQAPVTVLAGEHDGFTRLSLLVGDSTWEIGRTEAGYGLRLPQKAGFAVDAVFDVITRNRIARLHPQEGALDIDLACTCHLRSFRHQGQWLVLDIRDGAPDPASPYERALAQEGRPLPLVMVTDHAGLPERLTYPPLPEPALQAYRSHLRDDIVAAAGQGELELVPSEPRVVRPDPTPAVPAAPAPSPLPVALHHDVWAAEAALHPALPPTVCPHDSAFDMAAWAGHDFASATSQAYAALAAPKGDAQPERDLARVLIAYGFGREAAQLVQDLPLSDDDLYLSPLARIVDGERADAAFVAQEGCLGAVSLWRALAMEDLRHAAPAEIGMVIENFRLLPPDLRRQLGPRLAALFAARGDLPAMEQVGAIAMGHSPSQLPAPPSVGTHLADITARLATGAPVTEEDLRLVQSLRYESRGTPEETPVILVEVQLLSALGAHRQAVERAQTLPETARDAALIAAIDRMTENALPETFLALAVNLPDPLPATAIHRVAGRLIADGFADRALALLAPPARGADMAERRYLRAEAAAALGLAEVVEAELIGLSDPRADMVRAAVIATTPEAPAYAWRRADLAALQDSEDELLRQAARTVQQDPAPLPPTPLAAREALISQAQDARALANALLSRFATMP